jgi:hypothetical protein
MMRLPGVPGIQEAVVDTGAPLTIIPYSLVKRLREGTDFEWLPLTAGARPRFGRVLGWQFSFQVARFLLPLTLTDYTTRIDRAGVIAQFATTDPPAARGRSTHPIILGLWGGVLEGGRVAIDCDPATSSVVGAIEFP